MGNFSIFDVLEGAEKPTEQLDRIDQIIAQAEQEDAGPVITEEEIADYKAGKLPRRRNYLHLGIHRGASLHKQRACSTPESKVDRREARWNHKTLYVLPIPLPDAWLKDETLHPKAQALEILIAEELGFHVDRRTGKSSTWSVLDQEKARRCAVEETHCFGCGWLHEECQCNAQPVIEESPSSNVPVLEDHQVHALQCQDQLPEEEGRPEA